MITVEVELEICVALAVLVAGVELVRGCVDRFWSRQLETNIVNVGRLLLDDVLIPPCTSHTNRQQSEFNQHTHTHTHNCLTAVGPGLPG